MCICPRVNAFFPGHTHDAQAADGHLGGIHRMGEHDLISGAENWMFQRQSVRAF